LKKKYLEFCIVGRIQSLCHFSGKRVIDSLYQNYTLMNTHEHWRYMFCTNVYLTTKGQVFNLENDEIKMYWLCWCLHNS